MRTSWMAALCLFTASPGIAEQYGLDDMLAVESYGKAIMSPDGRQAVIERYRRYDRAAAYHFDAFSKRMLGEIMLVDLTDDKATPRPLFAQTEDAGYWAGSLSPDGRHLSVFRLERDRLSLGIVTIDHSTVRWLDLNPVTALLNPIPIWRDNRHLLVITSNTSDLPYPLDAGSRLQRELPVRWRHTASGQEPGMSVTTSGQITPPEHQPRSSVIEIDIQSLSSRTVTQGPILDIQLSGDGRWLAVLEEGRDARPAPDLPISPSARPRQHAIKIVSLRDGQEASPCRDCDVQPGLMAWSDTENSVMFFARGSGQARTDGSLMAFNPDTVQTMALTSEMQRPWLADNDSGAQIVRAGWYRGKSHLLAKDQSDQARWTALMDRPGMLQAAPCKPMQFAVDANGILVPCPNGLWRVSSSRAARNVVDGDVRLDQPFEETFDVGITERYSTFVSAEHRSFWIRKTNGTMSAAALGKHRLVSAPMPQNTRRLLGLSAASGRGLAVSKTQKGMSQLWLLRADEDPLLLHSINTHLERLDLPRAIAIPSSNAGLTDWLLLPGGGGVKGKLPLVIMPYPGAVFPQGTSEPVAPDRVSGAVNPLLMLSLGHAVLIPSMRHDRSVREPAQGLVEQIEAAADQAIATGHIDGARMVVYGHSFGGYCALLVATRSSRFRGIIASASIPDLVLQHGPWLPYDSINLEQGFPIGPAYGWAELGQANLSIPPWLDIARYVRNSPYHALDRVQSPVLLIHGDLDPVSVQGAQRMFSGLYRSGKNVSLIRFWGEGHAIRSPANIRAMWDEIQTWLSRMLTMQTGHHCLPEPCRPLGLARE